MKFIVKPSKPENKGCWDCGGDVVCTGTGAIKVGSC